MRVRLRLTIPKSLERRWSRGRYPSFDPALRIAVLSPDDSPEQAARRTRKCRGIAGSVAVLRWLADLTESGALTLPPLEGAVVFTGRGQEELSDGERDRLWQVLQAPLYEHRLGPDGKVIAEECEAHELHLLDPEAPLAGLRVELDQAPCACGNRHPRLRHVHDHHEQEQDEFCAGLVA